jgi:hypothetical protein
MTRLPVADARCPLRVTFDGFGGVDGAGFMGVYQALVMDLMHVRVEPKFDYTLCMYSALENTFLSQDRVTAISTEPLKGR